jgi:hypothetical protein
MPTFKIGLLLSEKKSKQKALLSDLRLKRQQNNRALKTA